MMAASKREKPRLRRLSAICSKLPEAERAPTGDHADFRARRRVFAHFLNNHHGDGIVSVCCRAELGQNVDRALREPDRFYFPAYIGPRGSLGLRLDGPHVDWNEVAALVRSSYRLAVPRTLATLVDDEA